MLPEEPSDWLCYLGSVVRVPGGKVAALKSALADSAEEWKRDATLG